MTPDQNEGGEAQMRGLYPVDQATRNAAADLAEMVNRLRISGNDIPAIRHGVFDFDAGDLGELVQYVAALRLGSAPEVGK